MGLSRSTTEKVKERADIEDVVNDYVPLKKKGQNLWACCPFHNEKSPSFSVSPAKQIYKCFGCGKAGDPIQFVMDVEGIGFNEAIRHLAGKYGIEIEEDIASTPEDVQAYNERESLYIALNFARNLFVENLKSDEGKSIGMSYFRERGFTQKIIEKFDLGYAMDSWDHMLTEGKKAGHSEEILLKAGLVLEKDGEKSRIYDRFRNRVIFTIHNLGGKPIAFGARILTQDKKQPKYINSPETEVYHKSDVLYGLYQAKQAIRQADNCYLVEGYTDVVSLHLAGIENVVASSGTSLTEGQIKLIKRFSDNVTVLYDGDAAGIKASLRGIDMLLEGGLNVKAVVFPDGDDPDSYSRKVGTEVFQNYLKDNARDFIEFKIDLYNQEAKNDPIKRADVIRQVVQSIAKIPDPLIRSVYIKESGRLLQIEEELVQTELNKIFLKGQRDADFKSKREQQQPAQVDTPFEEFLPVEKHQPNAKRLEEYERETLRLLIAYGFEKISDDLHVCEYLLQEIAELSFETPVCQKILLQYKKALSEGILPEPQYFLQTNDSNVKSEIVSMITVKYDMSLSWIRRHQIYTTLEKDNLSKTVYDAVLRLKRNVLKKMLDETMVKMKSASEQEIEDLQKVYMELKNYQIAIDKHLGTVISN